MYAALQRLPIIESMIKNMLISPVDLVLYAFITCGKEHMAKAPAPQKPQINIKTSNINSL